MKRKRLTGRCRERTSTKVSRFTPHHELRVQNRMLSAHAKLWRTDEKSAVVCFPEVVQEQYRIALSQIRQGVMIFGARAKVAGREDAIQHREREISSRSSALVGGSLPPRWHYRLNMAVLRKRLALADNLFDEKRAIQKTVDAHRIMRLKGSASIAHDLVMDDIVHSHQIHPVVTSEIRLVQRQHHKAMEELHRKHNVTAISAAVRELQENHAAQVNDIMAHHNVHPETAAQIRSVHSHHHDLMHDLMVRQKQAVEAGGSDHAPEISTGLDDIHKSVQQVHSIVMEEVMKKHKLHHVVVSSVRKPPLTLYPLTLLEYSLTLSTPHSSFFLFHWNRSVRCVMQRSPRAHE